MYHLTALRLPLLVLISTTLSGCALLHDHSTPTAEIINANAKLPQQWQAPLPHDGKISDLKRWWDQFDDPLLSELILAAETVSPSIASARTHIEEARANSVTSQSALIPSLDANVSRTRGQQDIRFPKATTTSYGLSTAWEIDLFGANSATYDASKARFAGARAEWHAARTSVAAEVANSYINYRACEAQLIETETDARSRGETARLTEINHQAGFESPANAALSRATAAQGNSLLTQQRVQCTLQVKALVALTAIDEPTLRQRLAARANDVARIPQPAQISITEIPAEILAQRPDLYSAAQTVMAAHADVTNLKAQRLPKISLSGNVGRAKSETATAVTSGPVWSLGPITVTLPIIDAGVRSANISAGQARYDEAAVNYAAKLRTAIREVEEALINLQSSNDRANDARIAAEGFAVSFNAVNTRYQNGLANLFELEDARRSLASAKTALVDLQRTQVAAWISLYRALGGGWSIAEVNTPDEEKNTPHAVSTAPTHNHPQTAALANDTHPSSSLTAR